MTWQFGKCALSEHASATKSCEENVIVSTPTSCQITIATRSIVKPSTARTQGKRKRKRKIGNLLD